MTRVASSLSWRLLGSAFPPPPGLSARGGGRGRLRAASGLTSSGLAQANAGTRPKPWSARLRGWDPGPWVILVEGLSDVASLRALAASRGLDEAQHVFQLVSIGGVTTIRHHLNHLATEQPSARPAGLCDGPEERFFARALRYGGHQVESRQDMERLGFFVCERDLEEEVIRRSDPRPPRESWLTCGRSGGFARSSASRSGATDRSTSGSGDSRGWHRERKVLLAERLAEMLTRATTRRPLSALVAVSETHEPAGESSRLVH